MVPFVYYLFYTKNHEIRNDQVSNVRKALYLFGFSRPFSRYADSQLGAFIREELRPLAKEGNERFPLDSAIWWISYWERIKAFGEDKGFDDIIEDAKAEGVKLTVKDIRDALLYTIKVVRNS